MSNYAHVLGGTVTELFTTPEGLSITDCFPASVAAEFFPVPDGVDVQANWTYDGTTFSPPAPPPPPAPVIRTCSGYNLIVGASDDHWVKVKPRDQGRIAVRQSMPETSTLIARAAGVMGTTPAAWFDAALPVS